MWSGKGFQMDIHNAVLKFYNFELIVYNALFA